MDISVYLPDQLKAQFDAYVKKKNTSRNTAIRKAVELLLRQRKKEQMGKLD